MYIFVYMYMCICAYVCAPYTVLFTTSTKIVLRQCVQLSLQINENYEPIGLIEVLTFLSYTCINLVLQLAVSWTGCICGSAKL